MASDFHPLLFSLLSFFAISGVLGTGARGPSLTFLWVFCVPSVRRVYFSWLVRMALCQPHRGNQICFSSFLLSPLPFPPPSQLNLFSLPFFFLLLFSSPLPAMHRHFWSSCMHFCIITYCLPLFPPLFPRRGLSPLSSPSFTFSPPPPPISLLSPPPSSSFHQSSFESSPPSLFFSLPLFFPFPSPLIFFVRERRGRRKEKSLLLMTHRCSPSPLFSLGLRLRAKKCTDFF